MQVESTLFFETPEDIYTRVFRTVNPRTIPPPFQIEFRRFANANSSIRLENGRIAVKITDLLASAPAPITEALAYILLCKLYRKPVPGVYNHQYRLYLNRVDVRSNLHLLRRVRGRKFLSGAQGKCYNLDDFFDALNAKHFCGLMEKPELGWSRRPSRTLLGHYDPSHNAIILSGILDRPTVPRLAVEYVMFHEMLHLKHPVDHRGARRCVHTPEFRVSEREFPNLEEAKRLLKKL